MRYDSIFLLEPIQYEVRFRMTRSQAQIRNSFRSAPVWTIAMCYVRTYQSYTIDSRLDWIYVWLNEPEITNNPCVNSFIYYNNFVLIVFASETSNWIGYIKVIQCLSM